MKRITFLIIFITIIGKFLGFGRELSLSYMYGTSEMSDIYLVSTLIPYVIFGFVSSGLTASFIPLLTEIETKNGVEEGEKFTNNVICLLMLVSTVIIIISFAFSREIVKAFAFGFRESSLKVSTDFFRITILSIYFIGISTILSGYSQVKNKYIIPAFVVIPMNIIVIISILLSKNNLKFLSYGFTLSCASQIVFIFYSLKKGGYSFKIFLNYKDNNIMKMIRTMTPIVLGISVNQINILIDRTLASKLEIGSISALNYSERVVGFVIGVFVLSIITTTYPEMAKLAVSSETESLKENLLKNFLIICIFLIPIVFISVTFSKEIIELLFARGAFDKKSVQLTSGVLQLYSLGALWFGLRELISRVFYALQDTKTPMKNAITGVLINIILNIILSKYIGARGLALATSISACLTTILLLISLRKKIGSLNILNIVKSNLKIVVVSIVMLIFDKNIYDFLCKKTDANDSLLLILSISIGFAFYLIAIFFMKIIDFDILFNKMKKRK